MIDLNDLKLSDILPPSIKDDNTIAAIADALDEELQQITKCINDIVLMPRIDELQEDIIDSLAWQLHVDYYEPLGGINLDKKRALVKNSLSWHRRKGTKSVINEIIRTLFTDDFKVEEWFEYGGQPALFRILLNGFLESGQSYNDLIRAVYEFKNLRSWLERIILYREAESTLYFGTAVKHEKRITVPSEYSHTAEPTRLYFSTVVKRIRRQNIPSEYKIISSPACVYYGIIVKRSRRHIILNADSLNNVDTAPALS